MAFRETARLNTTSFRTFSWSGNETVLACKLCMSSLILDNIYIDRFLLVAFVKYILSQIYSHCIQNSTFWYFLEVVETFAFIFIFLFYLKTDNFNNSEIADCRKLPNPSMNKIFNVLSIGLQYSLSYKWSDFGLKCLVAIMPKERQKFNP